MNIIIQKHTMLICNKYISHYKRFSKKVKAFLYMPSVVFILNKLIQKKREKEKKFWYFIYQIHIMAVRLEDVIPASILTRNFNRHAINPSQYPCTFLHFKGVILLLLQVLLWKHFRPIKKH